MAILNFIFGGMGLAGALCLGASLVFVYALKGSVPPGPGGVNPFEQIAGSWDAIPGGIPYLIVSTVLNVLICIALIVAGMGLLKMRPWARWLCIGYSIVSILMTAAATVFALTISNPAVTAYQQEYARKHGLPVSTDLASANVLSAVTAVFLLLYPIAMLIIMFLPSVAAAFAEWDRPPREGEDDREEYGAEGAGFEEREPPDDRFRKGGAYD
jgi:hypothetical protein